jgi:hypothetical protein
MPDPLFEPTTTPGSDPLFSPAGETGGTSDTSGPGWGTAALAAAGAGAGAYALKKLGLGGTANAINDIRRAAMLSGWAPLKSLLGNVGGAAYSSIERGSLTPIKELLSGQTLADASAAFRAGAQYGDQTPSLISKLNLPGRVMGAFDKATQNALIRAGLTPQEAARDVLQAPLPYGISDKLAGPVAQYAVPFRRTSINQFLEGFNTMNPENLQTLGQKAALGTALGTGALEGELDASTPEIALSTAASGKYGLPHALAAGLVKTLNTGKVREGGSVLKTLNPVDLGDSMYGPAADPTSIIPTPRAYTWLKQLLGAE